MKRRTRTIVALAAAVMCLASGMVSVMPVEAAPYGKAACTHPETEVLPTSEPVITYVSTGDDSHKVICKRKVKCKNCPAVLDETLESYASHLWYLYDNLGHHGQHEDGQHTYRLHCRDCGGTRIVTMICTGKIHSVPW